ncbi:UDP-N-acetylglucosamine--N-acetylmuramyl-(pentapeptide) pyrophosphoryl-undecaprenol N-acetylglucosamine transferase MurG [Mycobacteroides abscessus]|nr:UDP-N-acetylglucosamine--N-acetylmuramyl-(pentapeptide) pyrophosphoryl-undecaprenol N-acetylglucosamine transferase MurG [Mycobacteroides abscessus]
MSDELRPLSVVLAGGGTAGHVEPAMAVADALREIDPTVRITALGTERGLETRLVPDRGYHLELIVPVPLPRRLTGDLVRLPLRVRRAVRQTRAVFDGVQADVVIGFGGYVALPAYLAARRGPCAAAACRSSSTRRTPVPALPTGSERAERSGCYRRSRTRACVMQR